MLPKSRERMAATVEIRLISIDQEDVLVEEFNEFVRLLPRFPSP